MYAESMREKRINVPFHKLFYKKRWPKIIIDTELFTLKKKTRCLHLMPDVVLC